MQEAPLNQDPRGPLTIELPGSYLQTEDCPAFLDDPGLRAFQEPDLFDRGQSLVNRAQGITMGITARSTHRTSSPWASPESPMVITPERLRQRITQLERMLDQADTSSDIDSRRAIMISNEAFHLSHQLFRWRYRVCAGGRLLTPLRVDTRPYIALRDQSLDDLQVRSEKAIKLCRSFYSHAHCLGMQHIYQRRGESQKFIDYWKERFHQDRYSRLFNLRSGASRFSCRKENQTWRIMLPIYENQADLKSLFGKEYKAQVQKSLAIWEGPSLAFDIEWKGHRGDEIIEIQPARGRLSHVTIEEPFIVRLQENLGGQSQIMVLSHELGHVFGFPDCYIEFYDPSSGELIYYEHMQDRGNIMCTLEYGRKVPESYRQQLIERSCL